MKIVGIIENDVLAGGGYFQGLNAILQMNEICKKNNIEFEVATISEKSKTFFDDKQIKSFSYKLSVLNKITHRVLSINLVRFILNYFGVNWIFPIEKKFKQVRPDLLYFIQPSSIPLFIKNINFIYTVWDLCHRDFPEFPEVRNNYIFHNRENKYSQILPFSGLVVVDSDITAKKISNYYGVANERIVVMPFSHNPFLSKISGEILEMKLRDMNITGKYLFYPAQFWPHKNHIGILKAILILKSNGIDVNLIFVGGDKGNKNYINKFILNNNLNKQVKVLGFVSSEELNTLYSGCSAVIMPTFLGPTNLPPLEAWFYKKPLIYSSLYPNQVDNAAFLVDPYSPKSIADGIMMSTNELLCTKIINNGNKRLSFFEKERLKSEKMIESYLLKYKFLNETWQIN